MTASGGEKRAKPAARFDEIEQLKQLVAIQTQIVELAKQNELTERECEALRRQLAEQVRRPRQQNLSPPRWLRVILEKMKTAASGKSHA